MTKVMTWAGRVKAIFVKYNITDENLQHTTSSELDIFWGNFTKLDMNNTNVNW